MLLPVIAFTLRLKSESPLDVSASFRQEKLVRREDIEHVVRLTQKPGHIRYRTDGVDVRGSDAKRGPVAAQIWNRSFSSEISRVGVDRRPGVPCKANGRPKAAA
ncbi:hypothetical protein [Burkholderia diffusa]|uniref:hypothetical protein n=1 Tax=Burkholderia diffusa TaxID=488732 RepID=UPI002AB2AD12|nr:hypothetical protein [Burkholderia diffusa]